MRFFGCEFRHLKRIGIFVLLLCLLVGTIDALYSAGNWVFNFFYSAAFTLICAFYCTVFLCSSIEAITKLSRLAFAILFMLLVSAGVLLGNITAGLILLGRLSLNAYVFIYSLFIGLAASAVITGYFLLKEKAEEKMARLKETEIENERLKRIESEARLMDLQTKLNPHFLFNTLNATAALIPEDPKKAEEGIVRLAELYHRVFSVSSRAFIPVEEELKLVRDYLELEKIRFEERLSYAIHCPEKLKRDLVPGLLIEPIVENSIKHGKKYSGEALEVVLNIEDADGRIRIRIRDNGPGFDVDRTAFGFGLFSIQERLRLLFKEEHKFDIRSQEGKGTEVEIVIPKKDENKGSHRR